jgi:hypothetical protein
MTQQTRHIGYYSAPLLEQRPPLETPAAPPLDWVRVRKWLPPAIMLILVVGLYLLQSSFSTTSELEIARLMKEHDTLMRQNLQLSADIAELEKPSRIRERAQALGFVDTSKSVRLPVPVTKEPDGSGKTAPNADPFGPWQRLLYELARRLSPSSK